jgi:lysophospholipid acyltransferase (LPLAT)-like uncharacterized protein
VTALESDPGAVHVVDGPQGPKGEVKPGLIRMAQISGALVFPVFIAVDRAWKTNSWDRFLIPKPFGRVRIRWGVPIEVPKRIDTQRFNAVKLEIEEDLQNGHEEGDRAMGWPAAL